MAEQEPKENKLVEKYTVSEKQGSRKGTFVVSVTAGRLSGQKATVIMTNPSAAYFSSRHRELKSA